jgi:hypothetical protein
LSPKLEERKEGRKSPTPLALTGEGWVNEIMKNINSSFEVDCLKPKGMECPICVLLKQQKEKMNEEKEEERQTIRNRTKE